MIRVLIMGASGFIGQSLSREFASHGGCKIFGIGRKPFIEQELDHYFQGDANDESFLKKCIQYSKPNLIYYLIADWKKTEPNIKILNCIFNTLQSYSNAIFIYPGSCAEYGKVSLNEQPTPETTPFNPVSKYGLMKVKEELTIRNLSERLGINLIISRIFNVTGPYEPDRLVGGALVRRIHNHIMRDKIILPLRDGSSKRDFLDVRDVTSALREIGFKGQSGSVFNICSGKSISIRDYLNIMMRELGVIYKIKVVPDKSERKPGVECIVGDNGKLKRRIGWEQQFPIRESIRDLISSLDMWL